MLKQIEREILIMLKVKEAVDKYKVVVTAVFWAANHRPQVPRTGAETARARWGETGRGRLVACTLSGSLRETACDSSLWVRVW